MKGKKEWHRELCCLFLKSSGTPHHGTLDVGRKNTGCQTCIHTKQKNTLRFLYHNKCFDKLFGTHEAKLSRSTTF